MATFSSNTDVENRFAGGATQLAALTKTSPYSADDVEDARQKIYGFIKSMIGSKRQLPASLTAYPELAAFLREMELDLVEEELWSRVKDKVPAAVQRKADQTRDWLMMYADGKVHLPTEDELPTSPSLGTSAEVDGPDREWTRDSQSGMW